ncbi:MAG TPA: helix-turn-helix domain-containing protein [Gemmatimonadaceae bacterium]|nr:helix-turn-helix domain-containing protein [Gemmatimonadaceae bacterium]
MLVVARLTPAMLSHLRVVAGDEHTVLAASSWTALAGVLRARPVEVTVVDPCVDGAADTEAVRAIRAGFPGVAVLVYTSITAESTRAMLSLGELGVRHCILRGFDDEPTRFRDRLETMRATGLEERILGALRVALVAGDAPPALVGAVEMLFRRPTRFRSATDIAAAAEMPRRNVNRWLERLGIAPARTLVTAARVLRGYQYAQNPALSMSDVALRLGYADPRIFAAHVRAISGRRFAAWRRIVTPDQCVSESLAKLVVGRAPAAPPVLTILRRAAGRG